MKLGLVIKIKENFWNILKKFTDSSSVLKVTNLDNGYVKCFWEISSVDNIRIELSKSCFYAIRLFDISNKRDKNKSTCIMKEIQVNKFQSSISLPIPINKGLYYFEFGYRKKNGEWRRLAFQDLNLGYRIKKVFQSLDNDNWFNSKQREKNMDNSFHEEAYQLSLNTPTGGSEEIIHYTKNFW